MTIPLNPLEALRLGQWFKLICGASYQELSKIRNLSLVYSLAGADCIDVAADLAVVQVAREGIEIAQALSSALVDRLPWLMVSFNDGQDPHFRKAWFDAQKCPVDCLRPCEQVCPTNAILPLKLNIGPSVIAERCYGCGRCLPICPQGLVEEHAFTVAASDVASTLMPYVDAIEIHTQMGRQKNFHRLWQQLTPYIRQLRLVAVSCPDHEPQTGAIVEYLAQLYRLMEPKPNDLLWQTDGRSMSGDIGKGTTLATIRFAEKVLNARLPGYVQLAGGTNGYTVTKLRSLNLLPTPDSINNQKPAETGSIHGIAYGSYARKLVDVGDSHLEKHPEHLWQQVKLAHGLVSQIKSGSCHKALLSRLLKESDSPLQTSAANVPP